MFSEGTKVKYINPCPADAHLVFEVAQVVADEEGSWVLLVEGEDGGFGCLEDSKEFVVAEENSP